MIGTWHSLKCCARFDGLAIDARTVSTTYTRGPLTRRAVAPAPVAPSAPRPKKPAPAPKKKPLSLPPTHRVPPPKTRLMVSPRAAKRAALRAELASIRTAPGLAAAQRRAAIRRALAKLEETR